MARCYSGRTGTHIIKTPCPPRARVRRETRKKQENEGMGSFQGSAMQGKHRVPGGTLGEAWAGWARKPGHVRTPAPSRGRAGAKVLLHRGGAWPGRCPISALASSWGSSWPVPTDTDPRPELNKPPLSLLLRCPAQPRTIQRQALAQHGARADPGFTPELRGTPGGLPGTSLSTVTTLGALSPDCPVFPGSDLQGPAGSLRRPVILDGPVPPLPGPLGQPQARGSGRVAGGQVLLPRPGWAGRTAGADRRTAQPIRVRLSRAWPAQAHEQTPPQAIG